ncbi:YcxB family protein [Gorillibacterium sp. CAU 1737]|uniref:YcxB family protein n=1 Tax=Gorillibacterium sp. CAU 1737 TaxID=3140362 RepID=UPI003261B52E
MPQPIEVHITNRSQALTRFLRFHFYRKSLVLPLWSVIMIVAAVGLFVQRADVIPGIVLLAVAAFPHFTIWRMGKRLDRKPMHQHFTLTPEAIRYEGNQGGIESSSTIAWNSLYRVYESKTAFYLYVNKKHAMVLPKADITAGTPDELSRLMQEKLEGGYKSV